MQLKQLSIKNFRCFSETTLEFSSPLVLIEGDNGSGKTSVLEILHYLCYLRSFRTHLPRELLQTGHDTFFAKAVFENRDVSMPHELQVGFAGKKKHVKLNQKQISSYKELLDHYRIVSLTEDDLFLINGAPEIRRTFIDQALLLHQSEYVQVLRTFRTIVHNRNTLLQARSVNKDLYDVWTEQLWSHSRTIQEQRIATLERLACRTNEIIERYFNNDVHLAFSYEIKKKSLESSYTQFMDAHPNLYQDEIRFGRSLFGAHLDDFAITFQDKKSKSFASRGQQKLIILLLKIAQMQELSDKRGPAVFLLDDFMTDFDAIRSETFLSVLSDLGNQLIFTSPVTDSSFTNSLKNRGAQLIKLTHRN